MISMFEAPKLCEATGQPEIEARLDRPGEILAGWLITASLLVMLAMF